MMPRLGVELGYLDRIEELEAALKPFAELASRLNWNHDYSMQDGCQLELWVPYPPRDRGGLTVADFRRAKAVLEK